jgi:glycosyltransferase involved in cell wall biosynthesis
MRVLQWCSSLFAPGGRGEFVKDLSQALVDEGHEVALVHEEPPGSGDRRPFPLESLHSFGLSTRVGDQANTWETLPNTVRGLKGFVANHRPDVIHCHRVGAEDGAFLEVIARASRVPIIYTEHEHPDPSNAYFVNSRSHAMMANNIVFPSESSRRAWLSFDHSRPGTLSVIPNGVPSAPENPPQLEAQKVFFSGRHVPEKGLAILLSAWPIIASAHPDATLYIAGDGPETAGLKRLGRLLNIDSQLVWLGWIARAENLTQAGSSAVVVVPSVWQEPFGLVAAEASLTGRPVVASRTGGLLDIVADQETGILVAPGDVIGLAIAVRSLLSRPEWANSLGAAGASRVQRQFSMTECVRHHIALYRTVSDEHRSKGT